ncbi:MAG TPA: hypothetical protein VIU40_13025 [Geobacteraceae bacterium]
MAWARRIRAALLRDMGAKCVSCGATQSLEFDCIEPRPDGHAKRLDPSRRIVYYRRQRQCGNLQILCGTCNKRKGIKTGFVLPARPHCCRNRTAHG